jgi:hypothetical protein
MVPIRFEVDTPLGFTVRTTDAYWQRIVTMKHRNMLNHEEDVKHTLSNPDVVRRSVADPNVLLFYRPIEIGWMVVVVRRLNGEGCLIPCYRTAAVKKGGDVWKRR